MIVLLGMPRSGTTWIGKIFDSHPDTLYCHEPDTAMHLSMPLYPDVADWKVYRTELQIFEQSLNGPLPVRVIGKTPLFTKRYRNGLENRSHELRVWLAKLMGRAGFDWRMPARVGGGRAVVVWKSIESLGRAGVLVRVFPDATIILLLRNPCAYVASVIRGERARQFSAGGAQSEDYGIFDMLLKTQKASEKRLTLERLLASTPEERLAWRWLLCNEKALNDVNHNPRCHVVRYEDVCAAPAKVARELLAKAGLSWERQCADFIASSTEYTDSRYYSVYKDPLRAASRWKEELDPLAVERVAHVIDGTGAGALYPELQSFTASPSRDLG